MKSFSFIRLLKRIVIYHYDCRWGWIHSIVDSLYNENQMATKLRYGTTMEEYLKEVEKKICKNDKRGNITRLHPMIKTLLTDKPLSLFGCYTNSFSFRNKNNVPRYLFNMASGLKS